MDENTLFLNTVIGEIVAQLECMENLLADDGRFSSEIYLCEELRIAIEDKLARLNGANERSEHGNTSNN
jgi:hypothetical protein